MLSLLIFSACAQDEPSPAEDLASLITKADQGDAVAQHNLGLKYHTGEGVPQDDEEAVRWYRLAADQGLAVAQSMLSFMYATGRGVPQDDTLAHMWCNLAASNGFDEAAKNRDLIAKEMTPEQIAEAQRLAREWKPKK
jgi:TPR repeat protein